MRGLRVLRVLLPVALVLVAIALLNEWRPRPTAHREPAVDPADERAGATGVEYTLFKGGEPAVTGTLDSLEEQPDGRVRVEGVHGLEVQRVERGPLVIDAALGEGRIDPGSSRWEFRQEVVLRDPDEQLELRLPELDVDEAAGEARTEGEIVFSGPSLSGRAERLVYGLHGQPTRLWTPTLSGADGATMSARQALLLDGLDEIEWRERVRVARDDGLRLDAERLYLRRTESGRPVAAEADGGVAGRWPFEGGPAGRFRAEAISADWDRAGELSAVDLVGDVELTRGTAQASADRLDVRRAAEGPAPWRLEAEGDVVAEGRLGVELGRLQADRLVAWLEADRVLRTATADGGVVFESDGTRGEAARARYGIESEGPMIELTDDAPRKARLARDRTRVAADRIRTDPAGTRLDADGRVEATLLPGGAADGALGGLFTDDDAVNFVSRRMTAREGGSRIRLTGGVRGWQGERNLAAEIVTLDQRARTLRAETDVASRMPRVPDAAAAAADYVQIVAERLAYDDEEGRADYDGEVRLTVVEGWLESERLTVTLDPVSRRATRIESRGTVRLEWRTDEDAPPMTGSADRAVYEPEAATIRLYGEDAPAAVTRPEGGGGRTTGRVLTYHVDDGTLEVDSGERGTGRIRTGGGPR